MLEETKKNELIETVKNLMAPGKGILAADESAGTVEKRFNPIHLENTEDNRRAFRELFFTAPGISKYISGIILFDETIHQTASDGRTFVSVLQQEQIIPGIKVDQGTEAMPQSPQEKVTKGLEGLPARLSAYYNLGARFAKWRAVITIAEGLPTQENIDSNANTLAEYAKDCQEAGIVPIVEPEVMMDGIHSLERCQEVTMRVHQALFKALAAHGVVLEGIVLKSNMVISGKDAPEQASVQQVAQATLETFLQTIPHNIGGVVFLSGGQSEKLATEHLNEMHQRKDLPWPLTFSYARALQDSATKVWSGNPQHFPAAQEVFIMRAKLNSLALTGQYRPDMEMQGVKGFDESQASQD